MFFDVEAAVVVFAVVVFAELLGAVFETGLVFDELLQAIPATIKAATDKSKVMVEFLVLILSLPGEQIR